jgi:hypothetical protein
MSDGSGTIVCIVLIVLFLMVGNLLYKKAEEQEYDKKVKNVENFIMEEPTKKEGNPFCIPLGMCRYKNITDGDCCDVTPAGPIIPATCNRIPDEPQGLSPCRNISDDATSPEAPFDNLTCPEGKYTFLIPELRYDGIWTKRENDLDPTKCCWTLYPPYGDEMKTYGANKLSPAPDCSLFGKTIVEPPECDGLWPPPTHPITFVYDCHENIPCSDLYNIKCPARV